MWSSFGILITGAALLDGPSMTVATGFEFVKFVKFNRSVEKYNAAVSIELQRPVK